MNELISVIVPVYNAERLLNQTVESILKQTYKNIEVLLIDDGSKDNSSAICDSYLSDPRVKVFHRENAGLSAVRQFGIDNATGDYWITVDSDDYIENTFVERMYQKIQETGADIAVCGRYDFIDGTNDFKQNALSLNYEYIAVTPEIIQTQYRRVATELVLSDSWNKMYKTKFVRGSGVRFELDRRFNGNDFAFNYKLVQHCPTYCVVNEPLLYHRILPGSMVHRKNKPLQEGFEVIIEQLIAESQKCQLDVSEQLKIVYYNLLHLVVLDIINYSDTSKERKERISAYLERHQNYIEKHPELNGRCDLDEGLIKNVTTKYTIARNEFMLEMFCTFFLTARKLKKRISNAAKK